MKTDYHIGLEDVEPLLQLKTWWAVYGVLPLANRLVVLLVNHTRITPNQITGLAFMLRIVSGSCFLFGSYGSMLFASLFYYLAYVLDCVDGPVARLTGKTSEWGRYFDHLSDLFGDIFILGCLAVSQDAWLSIMVISMGIMHLFEAYISYLTGMVLNKNKGQSSPRFFSNNRLIRIYSSYRQFFHTRNLKSFISFPDYECLVFIIFPLLGKPLTGLVTGFYLLTVIVLYTVLSTFWAIQAAEAKFP